jgi:ribosomal protein S27AE
MAAHTFEGRLGRQLAIDLCLDCQMFWFDHGESLQLSPAATLKLFRIVGEHGARSRPTPSERRCPRCEAVLLLTHDRQRNTAFEYWRCPSGHGRLTSFFDFLREKDFVRPLSPEQVEELRRNVQAVNCSNCGAPVDLARASACTHCGSPLSMLDMKQAERLVTQLREADRTGKPIDPTLPLELARVRREVEASFAAFEKKSSWSLGGSRSNDLVGAGLGALVRWLAESD